MPAFAIRAPYYPIVYVRGYAMTSSEREDTFHDAYYGFSASSVEKREASPENGYQIADIFEGQLIRFMKLRDYGYADSVNHGLRDFHDNPSRSIWVCRFYDEDFIQGKVRAITDHARDLAKLKIVITLEDVKLNTVVKPGSEYFYDFEFTLSIRGTGVYLHRREQDPCENAFRIEHSQVPSKIDLHTVFLNTSLNLDPTDLFSYFIMKIRVAEYRVEKNMLWDYKYPSREIYSESLEIKVRKDEAQNYQAGYRWLSDMEWVMLDTTTSSEFAIPLRNAPSVSGSLVLNASLWDAQK